MSVDYTHVCREAPAPAFQLTVITVCWNALADLKPTVESVLRQKAKGSISIEHLVVDGASTDGTPEWLAEQLAAGNIERYVSEPDRGIYDAMNKGINLARGEVLAFLNAGDTYTDEDLAPCVLPICNGETQAVAAWANWINSPWEPYFKPIFERLYFACPCCHQAYFASARAYREIGGYDSCSLRCGADTDMMYRMYHRWGMPLVSELYVSNFTYGGMSANSNDDFRDENVEMLWKHRDEIWRRCAADADFKVAMEAFAVDHCYQFRDWQQRHGKQVPNELGKLQSFCRMLARNAHSLYAKCALLWFASRYLPVLIAGRECSPFRMHMARFWRHACHVPEGNRLKGVVKLPNTPLSSHPIFRVFRGRHRG